MDEVETKILDSLDTIGKGQETIRTEFKTHREQVLSDVTRISDGLKTAIAELDSTKKNANEFSQQLSKVQRELNREVRQNFGSPAQRWNAEPERRDLMRAWFKSIHPDFGTRTLSSGEQDALKQFIECRTAIQAGDTSLGGAVDTTAVYAQVYDALSQYGQWNTFGQIPVGTHTETIPVSTVRPTAYWITTQGGQITEGAHTASTVTLTIREAAAWIPVANAILQDSAIDLASYVFSQLGQGVAYRLDWACFAADGTADSTDGSYTGIASGGTAATAAAGNITVDTLDLDDFVRCLTTVSAGLLERPCKWWIHPQVLAKMCLIRDANDRPIFQNALEAPSPGSIGSILGYPVVLAGAMPSTDSAGQVVACFGDPQGAAVGIRQQFDFASSEHFQFDYYRTAFRVVVRAGFIIKAATNFAKLTTAAA